MTLEPIRVLVWDFVPAPFHVSAELRARQATPNARLEANLHATLHGGGPFANAKARITARVQAASFNVQDPLAKRYSFDTWQQGGRDSEIGSASCRERVWQYVEIVVVPVAIKKK